MHGQTQNSIQRANVSAGGIAIDGKIYRLVDGFGNRTMRQSLEGRKR